MSHLRFAFEVTAGFALFTFGLACCGTPIFFILWLVYVYGINIGWVLLGVLPSMFAVAMYAGIMGNRYGDGS